MMGSLEEVGQLETSYGRQSGTQYTGGLYIYIVRNQLENHSGHLKMINVKGILWDDKVEENNFFLCSLLNNVSKLEGSRTGV